MTAQPLSAQPVETIQQAQPAPVMHTQTQMVYVHKPMLESMFGPKAVTVMVMLGVILLFVGALICVQSKVTEKVDADNVQDKAVTSMTMYKFGVTFMVLGMMLMVLFMLGASTTGTDVHNHVRVGYLVFCAIMIFVTMFLALFYITPLMETIPGNPLIT